MNKRMVLLVLGLGLLLRVAACLIVPLDKKPWGDMAQYINLGASLADGEGYCLAEGNCWPGQPTIIRTPGWPAILSVPYRLISSPEWRWKTARTLSVGFDVLNILLIMSLATALGASARTAWMAGGLYAINPVTIALAAQVGCEPSGLTFLLLFLRVAVAPVCSRAGHGVDIPSQVHRVTAAATESGRKTGAGILGRYAVAGVLLGTACLVRTNWLAIMGFTGLGILWLHRRSFGRGMLLAGVFGIAVLVPMTPWLIRNAVVFHRFPVFGAGGGETFFGGNNDLAADPKSPMWGYIVQPGGIPGEPGVPILAARMNEVEVDRYWMGQGVKWLRENPEKIPVLVVGKLRRAFVPIPRNARDPIVLAASLYRAFLYAAATAGVVALIRRSTRSPLPSSLSPITDHRSPITDHSPPSLSPITEHRTPITDHFPSSPSPTPEAWMLFGAVGAATLVTTMVFCGVMRYVIGFEVLLCLPAGWWVGQRGGGGGEGGKG